MKIKNSRMFSLWIASFIVALLLFFLSITLLVKNSGKLLVSFIEDHAVPYVLKTDDVEMGCVMAESFTLLIPALAELNASPHKLSVMFDFLSGSCAEFKAWEEELRYLRAVQAKNITEAQDARISQKRYLNMAARRQLKGYHNLELAFSEISVGGCPRLNNWNEEFYWLVGLMDGLQAVLNDLASEGAGQVPLDISLKVGRGAGCLSNEKWWGLPNAIQAAIWLSFPENKPSGVTSLDILDQSVEIGLKQGMRVVQVIAAKIHIGLGNLDRVKRIIRDNVITRSAIEANPQFLFLDKVATIQLLAISDAMWTEATGKRTPIGGLGSFWDDPENKTDAIDIIDLL